MIKTVPDSVVVFVLIVFIVLVGAWLMYRR